MAKIADCKVDVTYAGPFALELRSFVEPGVWTGEKTAVLEAIFEGLKFGEEIIFICTWNSKLFLITALDRMPIGGVTGPLQVDY